MAPSSLSILSSCGAAVISFGLASLVIRARTNRCRHPALEEQTDEIADLMLRFMTKLREGGFSIVAFRRSRSPFAMLRLQSL